MHLGVWPAVTSIHLGSVSLQSSSLSAAAAEETTLQTIVVAVCGKKQTRPLQSERTGSAVERMASPRACRHPNQLQRSLLPNMRNLALAGTTLSEAAASSRLRLRPVRSSLHLTQEDGPSSRLPQREANVSMLVLKCRWWNPSHPVPNRLIQFLLHHRVSLHKRRLQISSRTLTLKPALSWDAVFSPRLPPSQLGKLVRELSSKP
jgi:hypothetical protein